MCFRSRVAALKSMTIQFRWGGLMNITWHVCVLCLLSLATAEGQTHPQLAKLTSVGDDYVHADGVWVPDVRTKETKLVPAVVDYSCYRHGGADLAGTDAFCLEVTA